MKKRYRFLIIFLIVAVATFFLGPTPPNPIYSQVLPEIPAEFNQLEKFIKTSEDKLPLRKNNEARIIWQHEIPQKTEYSMVYLHGFAGSFMDGYPVNVQLADSLNANLFLARWAGHGLKNGHGMEGFTPVNAWEDAKEALVIGKTIGEKVIILSTSTGGTLALKLAAEFPDSVHALINLSPNLEDDKIGAATLNTPWGYEIAGLVSLGERNIKHKEPGADQYWDTAYPSEALVELQVLVETTMNDKTFDKIKTPVLTLFYYENFWNEDDHVEVDVYKRAHEKFSTPDSLVVLKALATPKTHFIGSDIKSEDTGIVLRESLNFLNQKLRITAPQ